MRKLTICALSLLHFKLIFKIQIIFFSLRTSNSIENDSPCPIYIDDSTFQCSIRDPFDENLFFQIACDGNSLTACGFNFTKTQIPHFTELNITTKTENKLMIEIKNKNYGHLPNYFINTTFEITILNLLYDQIVEISPNLFANLIELDYLV